MTYVHFTEHWMTIEHIVAMIEAGGTPFKSKGVVVAPCDYVWQVCLYKDKAEIRGNGLLVKQYTSKFEIRRLAQALLDRLVNGLPEIH